MTLNRDSDRVLHILTNTRLAVYQHVRLETYATAHVLLTVYGYVQITYRAFGCVERV